MTKASEPAEALSPFDTTIVFPKKSVLQRLAKEKRDLKQKSRSLAGEFGNAVKQAVENDHLDRKAFSIATQLDAMDDERLHVTFHNLLHYMDVLGVTKRATAQEEMFASGEMSEPTGRFSSAPDEAEKPKGTANGRKGVKGTKKTPKPAKAVTKAVSARDVTGIAAD